MTKTKGTVSIAPINPGAMRGLWLLGRSLVSGTLKMLIIHLLDLSFSSVAEDVQSQAEISLSNGRMIDAKPSRGLGVGELNDDLDIVILPLEGACEVLRLLSSCYQPTQPRTVCPGQRFASLIPVPFVGVDAADYDVIS
jgi:hypothetical protein